MVTKVKYIKGILKPLEKLEGMKDGETFVIEIKPDLRKWKGILKDVKISSVELQHMVKKIWGSRYVSR